MALCPFVRRRASDPIGPIAIVPAAPLRPNPVWAFSHFSALGFGLDKPSGRVRYARFVRPVLDPCRTRNDPRVAMEVFGTRLHRRRRRPLARLPARRGARAYFDSTAEAKNSRRQARAGARDLSGDRQPPRRVHPAPFRDGLRGWSSPLGGLLRDRPQLLAARRRLRRPHRDRARDRPLFGSVLVLAVGIPHVHIAALSLLWLVAVREFQTTSSTPT